MFLGVSDVFCWLSNISIFDKLLNFDLSNINVMREACLYNNLSFVPIFFKICRAWVGGWGLSPKFFTLFSKTHFYGGHSLHISWRNTHLLHLYFLFSWWRHQMETFSASLAFVLGIHRWLHRGIRRSPVNSPHTSRWRGALMFPLIYSWTNGWVNNQQTLVIWDSIALIMTWL